MRQTYVLFAIALTALSTACSGAPSPEPTPAPAAVSVGEEGVAPQRLDDPIVIGSINWECFEVCTKYYTDKYCESACTE